MEPLEVKKFMERLEKENPYMHVSLINQNQYVALNPYIYTWAIIVGTVGNYENFDNRWCYHSYADALAALMAWDGVGEPEGWHRHPASGRRRENGDPNLESIRW